MDVGWVEHVRVRVRVRVGGFYRRPRLECIVLPALPR